MKIYERIKDYILPYMLALFLCTSIFGIFDDDFFTVYNLFSALIILVMFVFFGFMKKHKVAGTFIYIVAAVIALSLLLRFIYADDWGTGFSKWFLSAGEDAKFRKRYFYAFLAGFPFFFSTVVYYFSVVLYRASFLMLSSLVSCAVYVKVLVDMDDTYLLLIAGLNAALYAVNTGKKRLAEGKHYGKNAYLLSVAVIVAASILISSVLPKQGDAVYYSTFEKYFMNAGSGDGEGYSTLGKHSSNAGRFRKQSYIALYDISAPDILYFRRQSFDIYNLKEHCFYPLEKYGEAVYDNVDKSIGSRAALNLDDMLAAMKRGAELSGAADINEKILLLDKTGEEVREAKVVPETNHNANYLITSLRTYGIKSDLPESFYRITRHGQVTSGNELIKSSNGNFSIQYYPEYRSREIWFENGGADFTDESYQRYIDKLKSVLKNNGEKLYYNTVSAFEEEFHSALEYKSDYLYNNSDIPEDIAELAAEITDGCEYDYQKAEAIHRYFLSGEYTYDLLYYPPRGMNTASYFIFTSKRGTCSDFAMAYTLMARSVGLTVRYTEGFAPQFRYSADNYKIYEKDAHAYPEIFIQNTGWVIYDPTASSAGEDSINIKTFASYEDKGINFSIDTELLLSVIRVICILLAVSAFVIIVVPLVMKLYDNIRIRRNGAEGVLIAYRRLSAAAGRRLKTDTKTCTPQELCEAVYSETGIDLSEFTEIYEKVCFGGLTPDKTQSEYVYVTFRQTVKQLKK